VSAANVWALFDSQGYSYNNYVVRSGYWPRLYVLSIPDHRFQAQAASGMPSSIREDGAFYTATVEVRPDLVWSDGSALAAEDVAFTVNTALAFRLGFDWHDFYDQTWLDHAEAVDPHTVKFFYKQKPNVGTWQYGALQGPVAEHQYWSTRVAAAAALLPSTELAAGIEDLKSKITDLQKQVEALAAAAGTTRGEDTRQTQSALKQQRGNLDQAQNDLSTAQNDLDSAMKAARAALYGLSDQSEPRLGAWTAAGSQSSASASQTFENEANPSFPGAPPSFDRAVYRTYLTRQSAMAALTTGEVDIVLDGSGPAPPASTSTGDAAQQHVMKSPTRDMTFLVFSVAPDSWSTPPLRQALTCMLDQGELVGKLRRQAIALTSFVSKLDSAWYNPNAALPCQSMDAATRLESAIRVLKAAGYTWSQEPSRQTPGAGLASAGGKKVQGLELLVPSSDEVRATAAAYIQQQAHLLAIPLTIQEVPSDAVDYAVFSSHRYDAALLGWRVSTYPGYLCQWFGAGMPFYYDSSGVPAACGGLNATTDLDQARQWVYEIQSNLAEDLSFVPLYSGATYDAYRNLAYPFDGVLGGLSGIYGAPALAIPASP
jgi:ABC-type transport system substrate-binding protein